MGAAFSSFGGALDLPPPQPPNIFENIPPPLDFYAGAAIAFDACIFVLELMSYSPISPKSAARACVYTMPLLFFFLAPVGIYCGYSADLGGSNTAAFLVA